MGTATDKEWMTVPAKSQSHMDFIMSNGGGGGEKSCLNRVNIPLSLFNVAFL